MPFRSYMEIALEEATNALVQKEAELRAAMDGLGMARREAGEMQEHLDHLLSRAQPAQEQTAEPVAEPEPAQEPEPATEQEEVAQEEPAAEPESGAADKAQDAPEPEPAKKPAPKRRRSKSKKPAASEPAVKES